MFKSKLLMASFDDSSERTIHLFNTPLNGEQCPVMATVTYREGEDGYESLDTCNIWIDLRKLVSPIHGRPFMLPIYESMGDEDSIVSEREPGSGLDLPNGIKQPGFSIPVEDRLKITEIATKVINDHLDSDYLKRMFVYQFGKDWISEDAFSSDDHMLQFRNLLRSLE